MILRQSLASIRRTPWKSLLFSVLIGILALIVTLGVTLLYSCETLLNQSRRDYVTTAVLDCQIGEYPDDTVVDAAVRELWQRIDFDALEALPFVEAVNRQQAAAASVEGVRIPSVLAVSGDITVLDVTVLRAYRNEIPEAVLEQMPPEDAAYYRYYAEHSDPSARVEINRVLAGKGYQPGEQLTLDPPLIIEPKEADGVYRQYCRYHGTVPEEGGRYLICFRVSSLGQGYTQLRIAPVLGDRQEAELPAGVLDARLSFTVIPAAAEEGETIPDPIYRIPAEGPDLSDPLTQRYYHLAEAAEKMNRSLYAVLAEDPAYLPEFAQGEYGFAEGGLYTPADTADGTVCCLFPKRYADQLELRAGDRIDVQLLPVREPLGSNYWPGMDAPEISCLVTGIYDCSTEILPRIYLSGCPQGFEATAPVGYTICAFRLRNWTTEAELDALRTLLPEEVTLTVYDQGFANLASAMEAMETDAATLLAVCLAVGLALLTVFARAFVSRQGETLETMELLGVPTRRRRAYILLSTGILLALPALGGGFLARRYADLPNRLLQRSVASLDRTVLHYSNLSLGLTRPVEAAIKMPWQLSALCAGGVLLLGWTVCLLHLLCLRKHGQKPPKALSPRESSRIRGAGRKYLLLSLGRNRLRSGLVLGLTAVMSLFLLLLQNTLRTYEQRRRQLDADTVITGYLTSYNGRTRYRLNLRKDDLDLLSESGFFRDLTLICGDHINGLTLVQRAGEDPIPMPEPVIDPEAAIELVRFSVSGLCDGDQLIYLSDLRAAPEFGGRLPEITWLEGYDEAWFSGVDSLKDLRLTGESGQAKYYVFGQDERDLGCVAASGFLEQKGLGLGDLIELELWVTIPPPSDFMPNMEDYNRANDQVPVTLRMRVIGVYHADADHTNLYTRFANHPKTMGNQAAIRTRFSAAAFTLTDPGKLQEAKEFLWNNQFSLVNKARRLRIYPIIEDRDYLTATEKVERSIVYLQVLLPVLTALTALAGLVTAILLTGRRLRELAELRQLGMSKSRLFGVFWTEQLLLSLAGLALAAGIWRTAAGGWPTAVCLVFPASCLLGAAIAILRMLTRDLSGLLREKE